MSYKEAMEEYGIKTSIDDFGTGYSSLGILRDFPADEIKIDRSFINRPVLNDIDRIIVGSIIEMAKSMNMSFITEGVERQDQVDFLLSLGCEDCQGYLYDQPLTKEAFEERMKRDGYIK